MYIYMYAHLSSLVWPLGNMVIMHTLYTYIYIYIHIKSIIDIHNYIYTETIIYIYIYYAYIYIIWLVVSSMAFISHFMYGLSSFPLTNSSPQPKINQIFFFYQIHKPKIISHIFFLQQHVRFTVGLLDGLLGKLDDYE